jgi:hypothetical protein
VTDADDKMLEEAFAVARNFKELCEEYRADIAALKADSARRLKLLEAIAKAATEYDVQNVSPALVAALWAGRAELERKP